MAEEHDQQPPLTDEEIHSVFETLGLSTAPKPVPPLAQPSPNEQSIFFTITGHSPPLDRR